VWRESWHKVVLQSDLQRDDRLLFCSETRSHTWFENFNVVDFLGSCCCTKKQHVTLSTLNDPLG
jgi:hypothetical protein